MNILKTFKLKKPSTGVFLITLLCIAGMSTDYIGATETKRAPEYLIKAGYLYKFFFFFEWPKTSLPSDIQDENIIIGILGSDPFGDYFDPIQGKIVKNLNRKVKIRRFGQFREAFNPAGCHILFICRSESKNIQKILSRTRGKPILTVADSTGFLQMGGMINLINIGELIRWEINLRAIEEAGLTVSATIVQSAVKVRKD